MNSNKDNSERSYVCNLCNKEYASYKTLWTHNNKFHKENVHNSTLLPQNSTLLPQNSTLLPQNSTIISNNLVCIYCNKTLSRLDSLKRHINVCDVKIKNDKLQEIKLEKLKLEQLKEETNKIN